jgi:hypothetical protein
MTNPLYPALKKPCNSFDRILIGYLTAMWKLLLLILAAPCFIRPLDPVRLTPATGADRLVVAGTSRGEIKWGELRRAYGLYLKLIDPDLPRAERLDLKSFTGLYVRTVEAGPVPEPDIPHNGGSHAPDLNPQTVFYRQSGRIAPFTRSIIEQSRPADSGGGDRTVMAPDSVSWTVYPAVDLIGARILINLVRIGRVPETMLRDGGRFGRTGLIAVEKVELHPLGTHEDDQLVERLLAGQMSGPIEEDGHYKLIRLDRREAASDRPVQGSGTIGGIYETRYTETDRGRVHLALVDKLGKREGWE